MGVNKIFVFAILIKRIQFTLLNTPPYILLHTMNTLLHTITYPTMFIVNHHPFLHSYVPMVRNVTLVFCIVNKIYVFAFPTKRFPYTPLNLPFNILLNTQVNIFIVNYPLFHHSFAPMARHVILIFYIVKKIYVFAFPAKRFPAI